MSINPPESWPRDGRHSADLVLVCPHLGDGGVQRVVSVLANSWGLAGRRICVVTLYDEAPVYELEPLVLFIQASDHFLVRTFEVFRKGLARLSIAVRTFPRELLGLPGEHRESRLWAFIKWATYSLVPLTYFSMRIRVWALRSIIRMAKVATVVSFCGSTNIMTVMAARPLGCRIIISERNDPARQTLQYPWDHLRRLYYNEADIVTANTHGALESMRSYVDESKLMYVPNPVLPPGGEPDLPENDLPDDPTVLIVGRLHHQKAHDVLLEAFAQLGPEFDQWTLSIVGQGPEEQKLREQSGELGIAGRIHWYGQVKDPFPFYRRAKIFVLPSRYEGMPNALLEAMACGMAVIVTDASPGPLSLVTDGGSGIVIPANDSVRLARAIERLATGPGLRNELGRAAQEKVSIYCVESVLHTWERLIGWNSDYPTGAHVVPGVPGTTQSG